MKFTELEQCPWCGNEIKSIHIIYSDVWYLLCRNCGYQTDKFPTWGKARKQYEQDKAIKIKHDTEGRDKE